MKSIQLLPITPVLTDALRASSAFERSYQVRLGPNADLIREVAEQNVAFMRTTGAPEEWGSYLAIDQSSRDVVGVCGYKGSPDAEAGVEIAYFTFPVFEKQGYGTASAAALVRQAMDSGRVRVIRAHTLPTPNASTRLLERLGFSNVGTVIDPEDGPVWRWLLNVPCGGNATGAGE